jgi:hypothetical protein
MVESSGSDEAAEHSEGDLAIERGLGQVTEEHHVSVGGFSQRQTSTGILL